MMEPVNAAHTDLSITSGTVGTETLTITGTGTLMLVVQEVVLTIQEV